MVSSQAPGGFIPKPLPSPAPSEASTISYHTLPHPRSSGPLKPGSRSESNLIAYLDEELLQISRKYAKKYHEGGYTTINAVTEDLERLVDILWISSTPTLQTHYLLQVANSFNDYLASFPPQLNPTLRFLDTLDRCFYTLITGSPVEPSTPLSPALSGYRMNMTEKVRLKSVIERTRLHVVRLAEGDMSGPGPEPPTRGVPDISDRADNEIAMETGDDTDIDGDDLEDEGWEIEVAKVYDRSLVQIGKGWKES